MAGGQEQGVLLHRHYGRSPFRPLGVPHWLASEAMPTLVEGAVEKGVIIGIGVYEPGKVKNTLAMKQAYEMGKNVKEHCYEHFIYQRQSPTRTATLPRWQRSC